MAGGKGCRHEFEYRQGDATCVDFFKDLANGFTSGVDSQFYGRHLELLKRTQHVVFKIHQEGVFLLAVVPAVSLPPFF